MTKIKVGNTYLNTYGEKVTCLFLTETTGFFRNEERGVEYSWSLSCAEDVLTVTPEELWIVVWDWPNEGIKPGGFVYPSRETAEEAAKGWKKRNRSPMEYWAVKISKEN